MNDLDIDIVINEAVFQALIQGPYKDLVTAFVNLILINPDIEDVLTDALNQVKLMKQ